MIKAVKWSMVTFNAIFLLAGVTLLAGGIWLLSDPHHFLETFGADEIIVTYKKDPSSEDLKMLYTQFSHILISLGVFMGTICLFGLVGAYGGNRVVLMIYSFLLFLIVVFIIVSTTTLVLFQNKVILHVRNFLQDSLRDRYNGDRVFTTAWDILQKSLGCCGVINFTDFQATKHWTRTIPKSCCSSDDKKVLEECKTNPNLDVSNAHRGCLEQLLNLLRKYSALIIAIIMAICCGLLTLMALSGYLTLKAYKKVEK